MNNITKFSKKNLKTLPDKSFFFLNSVKILEHQIHNNRKHPLKSNIDEFLRIQPPKNKKKIRNYVGILTFISKYIYNLQIILRPFYLQLRDTTDLQWTPELHQTFDGVKNELKDGRLRLAIPNSEKPFVFYAMPLTKALELHFSKKITLE